MERGLERMRESWGTGMERGDEEAEVGRKDGHGEQ